MKFTTADTLLRRVKSLAQIPDANGALTDEEILSFADDEIASVFVPALRSVREEYFVKHIDVTVDRETNKVRIPHRAQGAQLHSVTVLKSDGQESEQLIKSSAHHIGEAQRSRRQSFTVESSFIHVWPAPKSEVTLRVRFYWHPGKLVLESEALQGTPTQLVSGFLTNGVDYILTSAGERIIVGSDSEGYQVEGTPPSAWGSEETVDIVQALPGFDLLAFDRSASIGTASVVLLDLSSADEPVWVSLAGETPAIQLPHTLHGPLTSMVVGRVLEALGDRDGMKAAERRANQSLAQAISMLEPRVMGQPGRIFSRSSPLRRRGRR